jgi:hypothetical protein
MSAPAMSSFNYFNYFTEVEEYFWRKRGAHLLVSPLDWAIVETWQKSGIPINVVLRGIDSAFESYARSRRGASGRPLKSLAYCVDSVMEAAAEEKEASAGSGPRVESSAATESFSREELRAYFHRNVEQLRRAAIQLTAAHGDLRARLSEAAQKLDEISLLLDSPAALDLEDMERRLTVLEEKLTAVLTAGADDELLLRARREMDRALSAYKRKMSVEQIAQLERQYVQKRLFEERGVPRLSLFYLT